MQMTSSEVERHLAICSLCKEPYKQPKILSCYHVNCLKCLQRYAGKSMAFQCKTCREITNVPPKGLENLPDYVSMDELANMISKQRNKRSQIKCCNHDLRMDALYGHLAAKYRCTDCKDNFCPSCKESHKLFPATRDHNFVKIRDNRASGIVVCSLCKKPHSHPKILPCCHVNCQGCLEKEVGNQDEYRCPRCEVVNVVPKDGVKAYPDFVSVDQLGNLINKIDTEEGRIQCCNHNIEEDGAFGHQTATTRCTTCEEDYCDTCKEEHLEQPLTRNHGFATFGMQMSETSLLKCQSCKDESEQPKILPCLHLKCLNCIKKLAKGKNEFQCPTCKTYVQVPEGGPDAFPDFHSMDELLSMNNRINAREGKTPCVNHDVVKDGAYGHSPATMRCTTCGDNYCASCKKAHKLFSTTKNHGFEELGSVVHEKYPIRKRSGISPKPSIRGSSLNAFTSIRKQPHVERARPRQIKTIRGKDQIISSMTVHDQMIIAVSCPLDKDYDIFIFVTNSKLGKHLKAKIFSACPKPFRIASMYPKQTLAVTDKVIEGIKLVSIETDDIGTVNRNSYDSLPGASDAFPGALAVTATGQFVFSDYNIPKSINVSLDQNRIQVLFENSPENELLQSPWYLCLNSKEDIVVCDGGKHEILIFSKDGKSVRRYTNFKKGMYDLYPDGLCVIRNDEILVCDRQKLCVHHLASNGELIGYMLRDVDASSLYFNDPHLYVGTGVGEIKIYQLY